MELLNETPFAFASLNGRAFFPSHSLTLIVKGSFRIAQGSVATLAEEQLLPTGDQYYESDDDGRGSCRYESDFAHFKPRTDLLLVGSCHSPGATAVRSCSIAFQVGQRTAKLEVVGERSWEASSQRASVPQPFTAMDLRYENSFGGPGYARNPVGKGFRNPDTDRDSRGSAFALPNILQANAANVAAGREIEPAGFGPLPRTWPQRSSKLGTYDDKWLKERWPWFAEDFDWRYHNAAPEDLQVDGYLRGDEHLYFENLHPVHSQYHSRLPGMTVRCFLLELADPTDSRGSFREVTMNLDTLWVDMDSECLVLVWRGVAEVASDENEKIEHVYLETENLDTPTQTHEYYEALFRERLAAVERHEEEVVSTERSVGTDAAAEEDELEAVDQELAAAEVERRATLNAAGIDPDERPPIASAQTAEAEAQLLKELGLPWEEATEPSDVDLTREMVQERLARAEGLVGEDLRTLDLSDLQMQGADLQRALLADAVVRNATLSNANLTAANLELADLSGADLRRATLKDADLTGANLAGADLTGANLQGAIFEKARLEGAILDDVMGDDAHFTAASLTSVRARNGMFVGADFSAAVLTRADFRGSNLREASMDAVEAVEINMSTTNLTAWRASEGADFSRGLFRKIVGPDSIWQNANLTGADLSFAELPNADFSGAVLANADLYAANVREARFVKANLTDAQLVKIDLFQGSLEKANLQRTNLSDSNLYGVELLGCDLEGVRTERANLKMTKLSGE